MTDDSDEQMPQDEGAQVGEPASGEAPLDGAGPAEDASADDAQAGDMDDHSWRPSLLAGRRAQPLEPRDVRAVGETFAGLDYQVPIRYDERGQTSFRVELNEFDVHEGIVVYGRDIYPGTGLADPNSTLGLRAAAAHEISHYYRWRDRTALPEIEYEFLDEALTSLDAAVRFSELRLHEVIQLIQDARQRILLHYRRETHLD